MARILDKDTRLIDVDFGPVQFNVTRLPGQTNPVSGALPHGTISSTGNGLEQCLVRPNLNVGLIAGSFVQYMNVDLTYMTLNNEAMMPADVSVQRTSPVPFGFHNNGNNFDQIEEYLYIFSRPLNNETITGSAIDFEDLRSLGLDRTETQSADLGGVDSGIPTHAQTIYAEKRMYSYNESLGATQANGGLIPDTVGSFEGSAGQGGPPAPIPAFTNDFNTLFGMPVLDSVTTWGTMSAITGPSLHCYRVVIFRGQSFPPLANVFVNVEKAGNSQLEFPPVNVSFLCKDPNFTEGQLLTRLANAMNDIPEGGPTA